MKQPCPYKGREKEKLLFLEGGERISLRSIGEGLLLGLLNRCSRRVCS